MHLEAPVHKAAALYIHLPVDGPPVRLPVRIRRPLQLVLVEGRVPRHAGGLPAHLHSIAGHLQRVRDMPIKTEDGWSFSWRLWHDLQMLPAIAEDCHACKTTVEGWDDANEDRPACTAGPWARWAQRPGRG